MKLKTSNRNWNKNQQILLLEKDYAPKTLTVCNDDTARMHAEKKNSHAGSNGYFYVSQVMSYYTYTTLQPSSQSSFCSSCGQYYRHLLLSAVKSQWGYVPARRAFLLFYPNVLSIIFYPTLSINQPCVPNTVS